MPDIEKTIKQIPTMSDQDLLNLFQNASRLLLKGPNVAAESVIAAIERAWKKDLLRGPVRIHTLLQAMECFPRWAIASVA